MARISSFTPEFCEEAVRLVRESNRPIAHVAKELDVNPETLRNWVRRHEHDHPGESAEPGTIRRPPQLPRQRQGRARGR
ncbi:transposase [Actinocatenispora sera]|uniref:transposase n=1 Tax=Actinocatenispora sera TaxID=390989 RepID=UPI00147040DD